MANKKPPTFHYLPKSRAQRLKRSWIQDHKIRSKWKAEKKRQGLTNRTTAPVEDTPIHPQDETHPIAGSDTSPDRPDKSPTLHDKQSLRDLRRIAYASKPLATQKADSTHPKKAPRHARDGGKRETGQPNMKLRMNVLLEKIKPDSS